MFCQFWFSVCSEHFCCFVSVEILVFGGVMWLQSFHRWVLWKSACLCCDFYKHLFECNVFLCRSRCWGVCFMRITYLCGCVSLSSAVSVCSSLTWGPWCCVSSTLYCQVSCQQGQYIFSFLYTDKKLRKEL